jgi:hypothetical protein
MEVEEEQQTLVEGDGEVTNDTDSGRCNLGPGPGPVLL